MCKLAIGSNGVGVTRVRVVGFGVTGVTVVGFHVKFLPRLRVDVDIHNNYLSIQLLDFRPGATAS